MVGTMPLVPMVPFESFELFELFGDLPVLELVFFRRSSLKKGIAACRCLVPYAKRICVSYCVQITSAVMEKSV